MYFPSTEFPEQDGLTQILKRVAPHMNYQYMVTPEIAEALPFMCNLEDSVQIGNCLREAIRTPLVGVANRADKIYSNLIPLVIDALAKGFGPARPNISLTKLFASVDVDPFLMINSFAKRRDSFPLSLVQKMVEFRLTNFPELLSISLPRWENEEGIIWKGKAEQESALKALEVVTSIEMEKFLSDLWKETGGKEHAFQMLWRKYLNEMHSQNFALKFNSGSFGKPERHGAQTYENFLASLGIETNMMEFYRYTKEVSIPLLHDAITSLQTSSLQQISYPRVQLPVMIAEAIKVFERFNYIPQEDRENVDWLVARQLPPTLRHIVPTAMGMTPVQILGAVGIYCLNPQMSPREDMLPLTAHEVNHVWSGTKAPTILPPELALFWEVSTISQESTALLAEMLCVLYQPSLQRVKSFLEGMLFRDARLVAEIDYHIKGYSYEEVLNFYVNQSPFTEERARKDIHRACFGAPFSFAGYSLGRHMLMSCHNLDAMCSYNRNEGGWVIPPLSFSLNPHGKEYSCLNSPTEWMLSQITQAMK